MSKIIMFEMESGSVVYVEIEETATARSKVEKTGIADGERAVIKAQKKFTDAIEPIREVAESILSKITNLSEAPDDLEVHFGLKANAQLGMVVASGSVEANYTVKLHWSRKDKKQSEM